ncbi:MAG: ATP phosphoribosyltransferase [Candidatus Nitrosocaldus sp.]|nr:ATP phosphoribosyltransferase [Candidatus Nitrosocaldus sp.]MDW8000293.1 ATP phosphoribosyltransferase [Candidatus Nitrosocaldus sp.]
MIKFAIPKGSIEEATYRFIEQAWFALHGRGRSYRVRVNDPEIQMKILRPQEIPTFVSNGLYDIGITGRDWVAETSADVKTMLDLEYGWVRLVYAIPKSSNYNSLAEMLSDYSSSGRTLRVSTEYLNLASRYMMGNGEYRRLYGDEEPMIITPWWSKGSNRRVQIILSFGATEAKPPEDTDAIIDITETGTTLEQNNLKPIESIMESTAVLIANRDSLKDARKREKIYDVLTLLKGVVDSRKKLHIFANVRAENLQELLRSLPALKRPTVSPLSEEGWYAVNTVIGKDEFVKILPTLRRLAQGLVVHEPRQILALEEIRRDEGNGIY